MPCSCWIDRRIKYLTIFALSSENIKRPSIKIIFNIILGQFNSSIIKIFKEKKVRVKIIGERNNLPLKIKEILKKLEKITNNNNNLNLNIAFNYGAINELVYSVNKFIKFNKKKYVPINEKIIRENLYLSKIPDPDILIRTGGFKRLSNFLLFQLSYTELFFTETLWPDFTKKEMISILEKFKTINRKYGL